MDHPARRLWRLAEPLHAIVYFASEAHRALEEVGLRGFWRGYFAGRAAPMGAVGAGVVTASFLGFHPAFVAERSPPSGPWPILLKSSRLAWLALTRRYARSYPTPWTTPAVTPPRFCAPHWRAVRSPGVHFRRQP